MVNNMKKIITICIYLLTIFVLVGCNKFTNKSTKNETIKKKTKTTIIEEDRTMTDGPVFDLVDFSKDLWTKPNYYYDESLDRSDKSLKGDIKALYYRSDYKGIESYAFAYLGIPENINESNKAPGVLLIHGGGGTAYYDWVKEWVNNGYVALAMDLEGHIPTIDADPSMAPQNLYTNSIYTCPHNMNYGDSNNTISETWMYYAVKTSILGNSLLHSLDCVNKNKIGACGVSWGGVITSIITSYDDRLAFSIMIYGSMNNKDSNGMVPNYYKTNVGARVWDDDTGLASSKTPMLFVAMNDDKCFYPDSTMVTASRVENKTICFINNYYHSQVHAMNRLEPIAFANEIVKGTKELIKVELVDDNKVKINIPDGISASKAYLFYTDSTFNTLPTWQKNRLQVVDNEINFEITDDLLDYVDGDRINYYYVAVEDNLGRIVTTNIIENTK